MPGSPCGRRWRRRRRHRTGTTLAQLGPPPKPRLGCGNGSVPPKGHLCRDPGRGHAWCSRGRRARWGRGGAAAGGCGTTPGTTKVQPQTAAGPRKRLGATQETCLQNARLLRRLNACQVWGEAAAAAAPYWHHPGTTEPIFKTAAGPRKRLGTSQVTCIQETRLRGCLGVWWRGGSCEAGRRRRRHGLAPPWPHWIRLQNYGWVSRTVQYHPGNVHARRQA